MEITNNYQPNFKSACITKQAKELLNLRLNAEKCSDLQENFLNKFKDSKIAIKLDTTDKNSSRLDATMSYRQGKDNEFFEYIEESSFASIFRSPAKFIEKIYNLYEQKAIPFINNGYKHI
jgi:hypothetical protein